MAITIALNDIGKKFGKEWIFRHLTTTIEAGDRLVIRGGNGSGKSTLLQLISGFVVANEGQVKYLSNGAELSEAAIHTHIAFASPYLQLIEDFTLDEMVEHVMQLKPLMTGTDVRQFAAMAELNHARNKYIRLYSSGMKQRLKLALAILSRTDLLLLDEPVSNLDKNAITWYRELLTANVSNRTLIVSSNDISDEHFLCTKELVVTDYKK